MIVGIGYLHIHTYIHTHMNDVLFTCQLNTHNDTMTLNYEFTFRTKQTDQTIIEDTEQVGYSGDLTQCTMFPRTMTLPLDGKVIRGDTCIDLSRSD